MLEPGTSWRQGHVLQHADAVTLGLVKPEQVQHKVVLITHDCDLQSKSEKNVEVIVGSLKRGANNMKRAKHPRILDLCFENPSSDNQNAIELRHENKTTIPKESFACGENDPVFTISAEEKQGLKQWLAAKYGRPAFPNAFEERLRAFNDGKKFNFEKEVANIIAGNSEHIVGVFFDLGSDRFDDLEEGTPYELSINVVYDAVEGGPFGRTHAEQTCSALQDIFFTYYGNPSSSEAELIALENCSAVADTHFSLYALRRMDQWRVEYISLEDDTFGEFIAAGL